MSFLWNIPWNTGACWYRLWERPRSLYPAQVTVTNSTALITVHVDTAIGRGLVRKDCGAKHEVYHFSLYPNYNYNILTLDVSDFRSNPEGLMGDRVWTELQTYRLIYLVVLQRQLV